MVCLASCGNKATSQAPSFLIFPELWNSKMLWGEKKPPQTKAVVIVPGLTLCMDLINTTPQRPRTHTQRTHSSPKWAPWRVCWGVTHTLRLEGFFFSPAIMAVLKAGQNTIFVLSMGRSDKPDSVLTWWSGELLMSPSIGRTRTFFTQSGKDLFLGFVLKLQPSRWTAGLPQLWEGVFGFFF